MNSTIETAIERLSIENRACLDRCAAYLDGDDFSLALPAEMCNAALSLWPGKSIRPVSLLGLDHGDIPLITVVNKAQLAFLDHAVLANLVARAEPVFADGIHVIYRRLDARYRNSLDSEGARHLPFVTDYLRRWDARGGATERRSAVIGSAYGCGNVGDDAVTLSARWMLERVGYRDITLGGPAGGFRAAEKAELVVVGGGGIIYDTDGYTGGPAWENISNYAGLIRFAKQIGRRVAVLGVGTQGVRTEIGIRAFADTLSLADCISVRDYADAVLLHDRLGIKNVTVTADLAFALDRLSAPSAHGRRSKHVTGSNPLAMICPSGIWRAARVETEALVEAWSRLAEALMRDGEVVVVQHSRDDAQVCAAVAERTGLRHQDLAALGVRSARALYRQAAKVVTARYHGVVFGMLSGAEIIATDDAGGKIGRLFSEHLPAQAGALMPFAEFLRENPVDNLRRLTRMPFDVVEKLEDAAMRNLDMLRTVSPT